MDILLRILFISLLFFSPSALSGIEIDRTRMVYPAAKKEMSLVVTNNATAPRLIQAWIDDGNPNADISAASFPFMIVPPISRLAPGNGQRLRVLFLGPALPQDRESVFWINILELQPKPSAKKQEVYDNVRFSIRSRLKLFYRPEGLPGSPQEAATALRWRLAPFKEGYALECENPSAFNISFNDIRLQGKANPQDESIRGMCPAKGKKSFAVPFELHAGGGKITVTIINDYGGFEQRDTFYSV